nr:hypothetical protein CFP56_58490 [Quercus suber]
MIGQRGQSSFWASGNESSENDIEIRGDESDHGDEDEECLAEKNQSPAIEVHVSNEENIIRVRGGGCW